jgi:hypothetical protein
MASWFSMIYILVLSGFFLLFIADLRRISLSCQRVPVHRYPASDQKVVKIAEY